MTNSQLLDAALALAEQQGYHIRHDHLGGTGSGFYQLRDQWWLVVDVAQPFDEQLEQVALAIKAQPLPAEAQMPEPLARLIAKQ